MRSERVQPKILGLLAWGTLAALSILIIASSSTALADEGQEIERFALIVGANDGGPDRVKLRYATTDAQAVAQVIGELGGVPPARRRLVLDPDSADLERAFAALDADLRAARSRKPGRIELFIYYSGHSDEQGLLLGGERLSYQALRRRIDALPSDVRVVVLDSCASGAMTRLKGGQRQPPFLVDAGHAVKGHAFLTSSSADEAAQESDTLRASFFTHYLVSGLRGAADTTGDRRVTLNEAYQFAFHETLARTESTRSGAQHPAYDIQLSGTGDLVLTDLRSTGARLVIAEAVEGRIFVRDAAGALVIELTKQPGRAAELGLSEGDYTVTVKTRGSLRRGQIALKAGRAVTLTAAQLREIAVEETVARGEPPLEQPVEGGDDQGAAPQEAEYVRVPLSLSILPAFSFPISGEGQRELSHVSVSLGVGQTDRLQGTQIAAGANLVNESGEGAQIAGGFNLVQKDFWGFQVAGGYNLIVGEALGAQIAGGINQIEGEGRAAQIAGGLNLSMGALNRGAQVSGGLNYAQGRHDGPQVSGGGNLALDGARGVQIAGGFNYAGELSGLQISVINVTSGEVQGAQIGLVNIAGDVKGAQIGLVNVSNSVEGVPLGLFNFVREGQIHLEGWTGDVLPFNAGLRFGSAHFYTMFVGGLDPLESSDGQARRDVVWMLGLGLGAHIPVHDPVSVDVDVIAGQLRLNDTLDHTNILTQLRLSVGVELLEHLSIFGGLSLNVFMADQFDRERFRLGPGLANPETGEQSSGLIFFNERGDDGERSGTTLGIWPGFFAGVRF